MTVQAFCTIADVKDLLSDAGVLYRTDDDEGGTVGGSGTESTVQANAIERAATKMNMALQQTAYDLDDLADNEWCKWCNATLAAWELCKRRGSPVPQSILEDVEYYLDTLNQLKTGQLNAIPGTNPTRETTPTVTNYTTEPYKAMPVRRRSHISTGTNPPGQVESWDEEPRQEYSS